jgi:hypothetical protein
MPHWLLGLTVAAATWRENVQAVAAVFAAVGVVFGLVFSGYQIRKARMEQTAQRALSLMQLLIEVTRVIVERPHLAPYIYDRKDPPGKGEQWRDEVLAYARLFMSFGEAVGWQIRAGQMDSDAAESWRDYFMDLYRSSPAVRYVLDENVSLLAEETRDLFGIGIDPSSPG